jgi:phenylacetate-CoA ligase
MQPALARTFFRIQERMLNRPSFRILNELRQSQQWPPEKIEELRFDRLRETARAAAAHTPYWREVFQQAGIEPDDLRTMDALRGLPLLDKSIIRERREQMLWRDAAPRVKPVRTSGSTNEALQFYTSSLREAHINAARMRGHEWVGVRRGEKEMYFWGSPVELSRQDRVKRFRDWLINDGFTNGFEITPERLEDYYRQWLRFGAKCIFSYPSSLALAVSMAREKGLDLHRLKQRGLECIITTSEVLGAYRPVIEEGFGVPVYDSYGLREAGLIAHECREKVLHTVDEQLLLETVDPETLEPVEGEGELVVTNLVGRAFPVLRYRTGDIVTLSRERCACGLPLGRLAVSGGRMTDFVVTAEGKWVVGYSFIYIARSVPGIRKFQVHQDRLGEIRVLLVTDGEFPDGGDERVAEQVRQRLGGGGDEIRVEHVEDIQPAPSGKYRPVISRVAEQMRDYGSAQ